MTLPRYEHGVTELVGQIATRLQVAVSASECRHVSERVQQLVVARAGFVST
jgi:hypothetical protein